MGSLTLTLRLGAAAALLVAATVGWAGASASPAEACSFTNHCYGTTEGTPSGIDGDYVNITPSCLGTPSGNFVTDELWLVSSSATYWVEVGYLQLGSGVNLGGITTAGRYGFWADQRPGSQFFAHVLQTNPSLSAGATAEISKAGSATYNAYFNGHSGTSRSNTMTPQYGEWGSETTSASAHSLSVGDTAEYETGDAFHSGVPSPRSWGSNSPQIFSWVTKYTSYEAGVLC